MFYLNEYQNPINKGFVKVNQPRLRCRSPNGVRVGIRGGSCYRLARLPISFLPAEASYRLNRLMKLKRILSPGSNMADSGRRGDIPGFIPHSIRSRYAALSRHPGHNNLTSAPNVGFIPVSKRNYKKIERFRVNYNSAVFGEPEILWNYRTSLYDEKIYDMKLNTKIVYESWFCCNHHKMHVLSSSANGK